MGEYEREIELYDCIEILLKYKWVILAVTLVFGATNKLMNPGPPPPNYKADAVLMVKNLQSVSEQQDNVAAGNNTSGFYEKLALADDLKQVLIDSLDLQGMSLRDLDGMLFVSVRDPGIQFTVHSRDPDLARRMVNKWADVFVSRNSDLNIDEVGSYYNFVTEYYETSLARLEAVEAMIDSFEAVNRISFLEVKKTIFDSTATQIYNELFATENRLAQVKLDLQVAENKLSTIEANSPYSTGSIDKGKELPSLVTLRRAQANLSAELEQKLIPLDKIEGDVEKQIDELLKRLQVAEQDSISKAIRARLTILENELRRQLKEKNKSIVAKLRDEISFTRIEFYTITAEGEANSTHDSTDALAAPLDSLRESYQQALLLQDTNLERRQDIINKFTAENEQIEKRRENIEYRHNLTLDRYITQFALRDSMALALEILNAAKNSYNKRLGAIRDSLASVKDALADKTREQSRLTRSQQRLTETVGNFSSRLEDARIAREKAAGDIRVLTRALQAKQLPQDPIQTKTAIAAGVGFLISTVLSLLIEYMRKIRNIREKGGVA